MWSVLVVSGLGGTYGGWLVWKLLTEFQRRKELSRLNQRLQEIRAPSGMEQAADARDALEDSREQRYSHLPGLRKLIPQYSATGQIVTWLEQAGSPMNAASFLLLAACCLTAGYLVSAWLTMPPLAAAGCIAGFAYAPFAWLFMKRRSRLRQVDEQLIDATHLMASAMRAGLSFEVGLNIVATEAPEPVRGEFRKLASDWKLHADVRNALANFSRRIPTADVRLFCACVRLHREVGGNFAFLLDQLGQTIRDRFQLWREMKALTAEGRFSGWVLGVLPVLAAVFFMMMDPTYLRSMLAEESGRRILWLAALLQLTGFGIIRWMTTPKQTR